LYANTTQHDTGKNKQSAQEKYAKKITQQGETRNSPFDESFHTIPSLLLQKQLQAWRVREKRLKR
tara:strand:+ start:413 stop:607 length:195 start_codon:yes stop_codon:yes gene_type:complete